MKCPKCGNDYEGSKCPYCGGLDIVVNESDYERRKKAYEEQNSKKEGNSKKPKKEKKPKKKDDTEAVNVKDNEVKEPTEKQRNAKMVIGAIVGVFLLGVIVTVGYFSVRKMVSIYFKIGEEIYKNDYNAEVVKEARGTQMWNGDRSRLFNAMVPADISGKNITDQMASMNGDYLGAVTYDDVQKYYTIWVWDEKGEKPERMVTSDKQLELIYVADDSSVIYKSNDIIGEGNLVANSLNRVDNKKTVYTINENVTKELIFLREKCMAYLTNEGNLYVSYFNNVRESTLISSRVSNVLGELKNCEDRFSESANIVHDSHMMAQLVYIYDSQVYYCNINRIKDKKRLFETEKVGMDIVYSENSDYAYSINRLSVDGVVVTSTAPEVTPLAKQMSGTDVAYLTKQETLAYITDTGKLISIKYKKGNFVKTNLEGGADDKAVLEEGKTTAIFHADGDEGLLVINNDKLYFYRSLDEEPISLAKSKCENIKYISYYGRKIYIVDDTKTMYIFDAKGKLEDTVKDTEFIWVG